MLRGLNLSFLSQRKNVQVNSSVFFNRRVQYQTKLNIGYLLDNNVTRSQFIFFIAGFLSPGFF
jgi:hypothetical protein